MSEADCGVQGVHDLVAALLVRHVGQRDPVKIDDGEHVLASLLAEAPVDRSASPVAGAAGADR
ncbi:hypothetical protein [Chenggangzhangella methanolivorans]|uniref:hypothetical protein n=1 Tax=Chenggangzhangella methanolivorans TaxID=1437009 RepID=UPI0021BD8AF3|nr:hypothetical protein [Chenggangzhangella methanolivorans]